MNKLIIISLSIFVIILVIILGLFTYSYNQLGLSLNDANIHSIELEPLSISNLLTAGLNTLSGNWFDAAFDLIHEINVNLIFSLNNNGFLPVYIPNFSYELLINEISIGQGISNVDITINPGETKEITSFQNIKKDSLFPAIHSIVGSEGMMNLKVKGTAYFKLLGFDIPIPFESSKQIAIYDEIKNRLDAEF